MKRSTIVMTICAVLIALAAMAGLVTGKNPLRSTTGVQGSITPLDAASFITQGKYYLQTHDILAARDQFAQAVSADPTNQEANFFYGVTRVCAVAEDGQNLSTAGLDSVKEILELAGVMVQKLSIYGSSLTMPQQLAPTTPRTGAILDFLNTKFLTEVNGAIANLAVVTNTSFSSEITPAVLSETSGANLVIDYADTQVVKSLLYAMKCNLELLLVYGLDASLPDILELPDQMMTYKQLFQDSTFLTPKDAARLTSARASLISFIDTYNAAAPLLTARSGVAHHLFVVDAPVTNEPVDVSAGALTDITNKLAEVRTALDGPHLFSFIQGTDQNRTIDLSKFFNAANPINIRSKLADCGTGTVFPDPTLNGLFPLGIAGLDTAIARYGSYVPGITCTGRETPYIKVDKSFPFLYLAPGFHMGPQSVTISNKGTADLHVSSVALEGANGAEFTVAAGTCGNLTPTLPPRASCNLSVDFKTPAVSGIKSATLQVASNDPAVPVASVDFFGYVAPSLAQSTLSVSVAGNGSIKSDPAGIDCPSGACSALFDTGTQVQLIATPGTGSILEAWSGSCSGTGSCGFALTSDAPVAATFIVTPPVKVIGGIVAYYQSLLAAYQAAQEGTSIQIAAQATEFTEDLDLDKNVAIIFFGGRNSDYTAVAGWSTLHGLLTVGKGALTPEYLILR